MCKVYSGIDKKKGKLGIPQNKKGVIQIKKV
jgi:hypothetical protein